MTRRPVRRATSVAAISAATLVAAYGDVGATGSVSTRGFGGPAPYTSAVEISTSNGRSLPLGAHSDSVSASAAVPSALTRHAAPGSLRASDPEATAARCTT